MWVGVAADHAVQFARFDFNEVGARASASRNWRPSSVLKLSAVTIVILRNYRRSASTPASLRGHLSPRGRGTASRPVAPPSVSALGAEPPSPTRGEGRGAAYSRSDPTRPGFARPSSPASQGRIRAPRRPRPLSPPMRERKHFPVLASGLVPEQVPGKCQRGDLKRASLAGAGPAASQLPPVRSLPMIHWIIGLPLRGNRLLTPSLAISNV